ncbi:unnamed protein product, partial [Menidia menidia]
MTETHSRILLSLTEVGAGTAGGRRPTVTGNTEGFTAFQTPLLGSTSPVELLSKDDDEETEGHPSEAPTEAPPTHSASSEHPPSSAVSEVEKIRCDFVARVSEATLKQLFDALRKDGVLNRLQEEEILQKNPVRADKARDLLDYVMNQGEKACKKMIVHLKASAPALSSELGISSDHPALK